MLVLLRSSTACNLKCRYCSASCGATPRKDLTIEDCKLLSDHLPEILSEGEQVTYLWHGGEPTILPPSKFDSMQQVLNSVSEHGHPVNCLMQTNGFAIGDEWLTMLQKHSVGVGLSLDGPAELHDAERITSSGNGTYAQCVTNLKAMRNADISVSLLCTVRKEHTTLIPSIMDWLFEFDLPIRFNPILELGRSRQALDIGDYYNFLQDIFRVAIISGFTHTIEPLSWMLASAVSGKQPTVCSYSGQCGKNIFSFGPSGNVGICNRDDQNLGNLYDTRLVELFTNSKEWIHRRERQIRLAEYCGKCQIWSFCHGGCPEIEGDQPNRETCDVKNSFWEWLHDEGIEIYRKSLLSRRKTLKEHIGFIQKSKEEMLSIMNYNAARTNYNDV